MAGFVFLAMSLRTLQRFFSAGTLDSSCSNIVLLYFSGFLAGANLSFLTFLDVVFCLPASDVFFLCVLIFSKYFLISVLTSRFTRIVISIV